MTIKERGFFTINLSLLGLLYSWFRASSSSSESWLSWSSLLMLATLLAGELALLQAGDGALVLAGDGGSEIGLG